MRKKIFFLVIIALIGNNLFSQTYTYKFSHDASGNRTVRWLEVLKLASEPDSTISFDTDSLYKMHVDKLEKMASVYPNPNKGIINIKLIQDKQFSAEYAISNLNGQELMKGKLYSTSTQIDISSFSTGTYIVKIKSDGIIASWKIIKLE